MAALDGNLGVDEPIRRSAGSGLVGRACQDLWLGVGPCAPTLARGSRTCRSPLKTSEGALPLEAFRPRRLRYRLRQVEPFGLKQPVRSARIHPRPAPGVAVDDRQATHSVARTIRCSCPNPSFPVSPPPSTRCGVAAAARFLRTDVRGRCRPLPWTSVPHPKKATSLIGRYATGVEA